MRTKEECLDKIVHRYTDMEEMRKAIASMRRMGYDKKITAANSQCTEVTFTRILS